MEIPHGTPSGYSWHKCRCDVCVGAKRERDRAYYQRNAEKVKARASEYYEANKPEVAVRARQYREANADAIKANKQRYYLEHRDETIARATAWRKANPERYKEHAANNRALYRAERRASELARYYKNMAENPEKIRAVRRAWAKTVKGKLYARNAQETRRRGAPYTPEALAWIASLVDPICTYCGRMATEIDHIVAVTNGGSGELANLTPACRRCNSKKSNLSVEAFLARLEKEK